MNRIYKVIWSNVRGCYVVTSEFSSSIGKKKSLSSRTRDLCKVFLPVALSITLLSGGVLAADSNWGAGGNVANSNASGSKAGTATAFGGESTDVSSGSYSTSATATNATAFGEGTKASGQNSTAFGQQTTATGKDATSFGQQTTASGARATSFGEKTSASGTDATAFGNYTKATNTGSTALGNGSVSSGLYSTSFGAGIAAGMYSTAFGNGSVAGLPADTNGAIGLTQADDSVIMVDSADYSAYTAGSTTNSSGYKAYTDSQGKTYSVQGSDRVYTVLVTSDGRAVYKKYKGEIYAVTINSDGTATGGARTPDTESNLVMVTGSVTPVDNATAFGNETVASGQNATAFGNDTTASGTNATAFGSQSKAAGDNATAFGTGSSASGNNSLAVLGGTTAEGADNAIAMGSGAKAEKVDTVALGKAASASAANTLAIGNGASATADNAVAIGAGSAAGVAKGTASGEINGKTYSYAGTDPVGTMSVGASGKERTLTNVAAGQITATSTDAVNGSQLYATNQAVGENGAVISNLQKGWNLTTASDGGKAEGSSVSPVKAGNTVTLSAGSNIFMKQEANKVAVGVSDTPVFTKVTETSVPVDGNAGSTTVTDAKGTTVTKTNEEGKVIESSSHSSSGVTNTKNGESRVTAPAGEADTTETMGEDGTVTSVTTTPGETTQKIDQGSSLSSDQLQLIAKDTKEAVTHTVTTTTTPATEETPEEKTTSVKKEEVKTEVDNTNDQNAKGITLTETTTTTTTTTVDDKPSVTTTTTTTSTSSYGPNGVTIHNTDNAGDTTTVSLTSSGLNNGGNTITNVAPGVNDTDVVNVAQLNAQKIHFYSVNSTDSSAGNYDNTGATGANALAAGVNAQATGDQSVSVGNGTKAWNAESIALGDSSSAYGNGGVAIGGKATASDRNTVTTGAGVNATAVGSGANAYGDDGVALGTLTGASKNATAVGSSANAFGENAIAVGNSAAATTSSIAIGDSANAAADSITGAVAIGWKAGVSGKNGTAVGSNAFATGAEDLALGYNAHAASSPVQDERGYILDSKGTTAIGSTSQASGSQTVALGYGAAATGAYTTALGASAASSGNRTLAEGYKAGAAGTDTIAIGTKAGASDIRTIAIGAAKENAQYGAKAAGTDTVALGTSAVATGTQLTAIGTGADASGYDAVALGTGAGAVSSLSGSSVVAIGKNANATINMSGYSAVSIGESANATGNNSVALGYKALSTSSKNTTAIGSEAAATGEDGNAIGYKAKVFGKDGNAIGTSATATGTGSNALGSGAGANGLNSTAIGTGAKTAVENGLALGTNSTADNTNTIAIGTSAKAENSGSTAIGEGASALGGNSLALGTSAQSATTNSIAVGNTAKAVGSSSIAIGQDSVSDADNNISLGNTSNAKGSNSVAIGMGAKSYTENSVAIGSQSVASTEKGAVGYDVTGFDHSADTSGTWKSTLAAVSVGDAANSLTRQITGVAAGTNDTDAVNVAQLKQLSAATKTEVSSHDHTVTVTPSTDADDGHTTYDLSVATGKLSAADGKVTATNDTYTTTTTDGEGNTINTSHDIANSYATVSDVAEAINSSGFTLTTSQSDGTAAGTTAETIHPGDTVTIDAGKNIKITQAGSKISVATADDLAVNSVTARSTATDGTGNTVTTTTVINGSGTTTTQTKTDKDSGEETVLSTNTSTAGGVTVTDTDGNTSALSSTSVSLRGKDITTPSTVLTNGGVTITPSGGDTSKTVSLTDRGLSNGGNQITNVADGTADMDAVNVSQLNTTNQNVTSNADSISTLKKGWNAAVAAKDGGKSTDSTTGTDAEKKTKKNVHAEDTVIWQAGENLAVDQAGKTITYSLQDTVTLGMGANQVVLDGTAGTVSLGQSVSGSMITLNGNSGSINVGGSGGATLKQGTITKTVDDGNGGTTKQTDTTYELTGLTNKDLSASDYAQSGRAATEEQLEALKRSLGDVITTSAVKLDNGTNTTVTGTGTSADSYKVNVDSTLTHMTEVQFDQGDNRGALNGGGFYLTQAGNIDPDNPTKILDATKEIRFALNGMSAGMQTVDNVKSAISGQSGTSYLEKLKAANDSTASDSNTAGLPKNSAVNVSDLYNTATALENEGLQFSANSGGTVTNRLGSKVTVKGSGAKEDDQYSGDNIKTKVSQDTDGNTTIEFMLDKNLTVDSITAGNTTISVSGITIANTTDASNTVSLTSSGLNNGGNVISNVASGGTTVTNAANIGDVLKKRNTYTAGTNIASITKGTSDDNGTSYTINAKGAAVAVGTNTHVSSATDSSTNLTTYTVSADKTALTADTDGGMSVTSKNATDDRTGAITTTYTVGLADDTKKQIATGETAYQKVISDGITFKGDTENTTTKKLGDTLTVNGDANITTAVDTDGSMKVKLSDNLKDISSISNTKNVTDPATGTSTVTGTTVTLSENENKVDAGGAKVTNIAAGAISSGSTDAVNGSQLQSMGNSVANVIGGSTAFTDGMITVPDTGISNTGKNNVSDAITAARTTVASKNGTVTVTGTESGGAYAYDLSVAKTGLSVMDGMAAADSASGTGTDSNGFVTAGDVVNVVNNSGFTLKTSAASEGTKDTASTGDELINPGDTVEMIAGNNMKVTQAANGKITYATENDVEFTSVTSSAKDESGNTVSTTIVNGSGITITPASSSTSRVSLTAAGLDNGNNTITRVKSGLANSDGTTSTLENATGDTLTNAANIGDLQNAVNNISGNLVDKGLTFSDGKASKTSKLGSTVTVKGGGTKADTAYSDSNIKTKITQDADGNTTLDIMLDKDLTAESLKVGTSGKDGVSITGPSGTDGIDGKMGISGKDGKDAVSMSGKDGVGYIGLTGPSGTNGKDGTSAIEMTVKNGYNDSSTGVKGEKGIDGKNGITRIVYTDSTGEYQAATMDDGMTYAGDDGQTNASKAISKKLNSTVDIVGGADSTKLTDKNIGVNNVDGKLKIQLASELTGLTSAVFTDGSKTTTVNGGGVTITTSSGDSTKTVSLTDSGLNNGGNKITNVAAGEEDTDAVNVRQLNEVVKSLAGQYTTVKTGNNLTVTEGTNTSGGKEYTVGLANKVTLGSGNNAVTVDGTSGTITAGDKVTINGTAGDITTGNIAVKGSTGEISGLTNTDYVAGTTGKNGREGIAATEGQLAQLGDKITNLSSAENGGGFGLKAEDGNTVSKDLGGAVEVVGDNTNISTAVSEGMIKISLKDSISVNTVTANTLTADDGSGNSTVTSGSTSTYKDSFGNTAVMNAGGMTVTSGGKETSLTGDKGLTVGGNTYITSDGINANGQTIANVAAGTADTDAVNVGQLKETNAAVIQNRHAINHLGDRVDRVGAGAAALAALHPLDFDPDDKWDFAAGFGNYRGAHAASVGAFYRPNEDTMFSIGGSFGGGENMVNAGVSIKLGQGNHISTSRVAMAKEIKALNEKVSMLESALAKTNPSILADGGKSVLFPDVSENHWAYEYVTKLGKEGIVEGYPDGTFGGDRMMTRYEFATIVYRIMQSGRVSQSDDMDHLVKEFMPELQYIRIDVVSKHKDGTPDIERVRVI